MFRATSCLCLPASSEHLPPHSRARSAPSSPSPQTPLRRTGSSCVVCAILSFSGSLLPPPWRAWASPWWKTRLGRSRAPLECLTRPPTPPSPLPSSWTTRASWWPPSPPAPRLLLRISPIWKIWYCLANWGGWLCRGGVEGGGSLQGVRCLRCLVSPFQGHSSKSIVKILNL